MSTLKTLRLKFIKAESALRHHGPLVVIVALGVIFLLLLATVALQLRYQGRTFPGVRVASQLSGGLTKEELALSLSTRGQNYLTTPLIIKSGEKTVVIDQRKIVSFNYQKTVDRAYQVGRSGNFLSDWDQRVKSLYGAEDLSMIFSLDEKSLDESIQQLVNQIDTPPTDASITLGNASPTLSGSQNGLGIDQGALRIAILSHIVQLNSAPIDVSPVIIQPKVTISDAEPALYEARSALSSPLTLTWQDRTWPLSPNQLSNLLTFTQSRNVNLITLGSGQDAINIGQFRTVKKGAPVTGNPELHLALDSDKLKQFVLSIASSINQPADEPRLQFVGGQVQLLQSGQEGREVDQDILATKIIAALTGTTSRSVSIPVKLSPPKITLSRLNSLGIKELIGSGSSSYAGSIPGRNTNISVGAQKVNGALVAPGDNFSLYKTIGEVTPEAGYALSYVIIGHRTEIGLGGGICQVSTTLFRAALNAGLPIMERDPHAYRVHYYELNSGPGLDATVFFPAVDFKFKNDTPGWILVQTVNDTVSHTLTFELYGTSDGRKSVISNPVVTGVTPAPAPLYQDDPTLPVGTTKQVDWAVDGANVYFSRTVTRDGQTIINDTYYSHYAPWQSVFMVGTKPN